MQILEHFLSARNLKQKLKWFFKPKRKPNVFLLNCAPGSGSGKEEEVGQRLPDGVLQQIRARGHGGLEILHNTAETL